MRPALRTPREAGAFAPKKLYPLPRFVPTDEQRKIVEKAAGFGLP
jgi:hypothetical protein